MIELLPFKCAEKDCKMANVACYLSPYIKLVHDVTEQIITKLRLLKIEFKNNFLKEKFPDFLTAFKQQATQEDSSEEKQWLFKDDCLVVGGEIKLASYKKFYNIDLDHFVDGNSQKTRKELFLSDFANYWQEEMDNLTKKQPLDLKKFILNFFLFLIKSSGIAKKNIEKNEHKMLINLKRKQRKSVGKMKQFWFSPLLFFVTGSMEGEPHPAEPQRPPEQDLEEKKIKKFTAQLFQSVKRGFTLQQIFDKIELDSNMHSHALKLEIFLNLEPKLSRYEKLLQTWQLMPSTSTLLPKESEEMGQQKMKAKGEDNEDFF